MSRLDESRPFIPVGIAVLTVSDTRSLAEDKSGQTLADRIEAAGHKLAARDIVTDDTDKIRERVLSWSKDAAIDVIITTGGTGFTGRDVTPEALEPIFEKRMDGFSEVFHRISYDKIGTSTIQSRATGGVRQRHLRVRAARLARRLPRRLGRHHRGAARLSPHALQFRGDHAAARRASRTLGRQGRLTTRFSAAPARSRHPAASSPARAPGLPRWRRSWPAKPPAAWR